MFRHILVAIDSESSLDWEHTLPAAVRQAEINPGAILHVMTVVPDLGMSIVGQFFPKGYEKKVTHEVLERLKAETKRRVPAPLQVQNIVCEGNVYESVLRTAKKIDAGLIVIGAHRPELSDYLLGPNSARVVRHANCSVLVVRPGTSNS